MQATLPAELLALRAAALPVLVEGMAAELERIQSGRLMGVGGDVGGGGAGVGIGRMVDLGARDNLLGIDVVLVGHGNASFILFRTSRCVHPQNAIV